MDAQKIHDNLTQEVTKQPLYYNQEGLDRLTEAALDFMPKPVVDVTVTHASGTLFCAVARIHYE